MTPFASGGGCKNTLGAGSCISWTQNTLKGDFYVNSWSGISSQGTAYVYIMDRGTRHYKYTVLTNKIGRYPYAEQPTPAGSVGTGYTIVDFYDKNGNFTLGALSPIQYFP